MSDQNPDLQILIRQSTVLRRTELSFEVRASSPSLGLNFAEFGPIPLKSNPETYTRAWGEDIYKEFLHKGEKEVRAEHRELDAAHFPIAAEHRLAGKGATLFKELLPERLQHILWSLQGKISTIQILSDEPHIPWEVLKLRKREGDSWRDGPYLCEAFAVTRWLRGIPEVLELPMSDLALVIPQHSQLPNAAQERTELLSLAASGRKVSEIEPRFSTVTEALATGRYDAWHFSGHGKHHGPDPNRWDICLDDQSTLRPEDLNAAISNMGFPHPLVFFNACHTGRAGFSLAGVGGWSKQLLDLGVGAFIGTHWAIGDHYAKEFALAFYKYFLSGVPIAESVRQARLYLHKRFPGDPTWLAYTIFAHPLAVCTLGPTTHTKRHHSSPLIIPEYVWRSDHSPPSTLLRADCRVVPFHSREAEVEDLISWSQEAAPVLVRLCTGPTGSGKTRLALEFARQLRANQWSAGFLKPDSYKSREQLWNDVSRHGGGVLLIVDDAEARIDFLIQLLGELSRAQTGPIRLILLAQAALDWWECLRAEGHGVGELLRGPATSQISLVPLALSASDRLKSYQIAFDAFSSRLDRPLSSGHPAALTAQYFERVLLLHINALLAVEGFEEETSEDGLLDLLLRGERHYWRAQAIDKGFAPEILPRVERALAAVTLVGGVESQAGAVAVLRSLPSFGNQSDTALTAVTSFLHDYYSEAYWIDPLLPELLGKHLVESEISEGADELLGLIFGIDKDLYN